jgi:CheY-like chemotaxis protein
MTSAAPRVKRRVLIVDDNEDAAMTMAMLIEELGAETCVAYDGVGGLQAAAEFLPDVVLLDIGMPGMNGYETCRRLRVEPFGQAIVIAALTGWGQEKDKRMALESGFDLHLVKPVDPSVLKRILSRSPRD